MGGPGTEQPLQLDSQLYITERGVPMSAVIGNFTGQLISTNPAEYEHINNILEVTYAFNLAAGQKVEATLDLLNETITITCPSDETSAPIHYADARDLLEQLKLRSAGDSEPLSKMTSFPTTSSPDSIQIQLATYGADGLKPRELCFSYAQLIQAAMSALETGVQIERNSLLIDTSHWTPAMTDSGFVKSKNGRCTAFYLELQGTDEQELVLKRVDWG